MLLTTTGEQAVSAVMLNSATYVTLASVVFVSSPLTFSGVEYPSDNLYSEKKITFHRTNDNIRIIRIVIYFTLKYFLLLFPRRLHYSFP